MSRVPTAAVTLFDGGHERVSVPDRGAYGDAVVDAIRARDPTTGTRRAT